MRSESFYNQNRYNNENLNSHSPMHIPHKKHHHFDEVQHSPMHIPHEKFHHFDEVQYSGIENFQRSPINHHNRSQNLPYEEIQYLRNENFQHRSPINNTNRSKQFQRFIPNNAIKDYNNPNHQIFNENAFLRRNKNKTNHHSLEPERLNHYERPNFNEQKIDKKGDIFLSPIRGNNVNSYYNDSKASHLPNYQKHNYNNKQQSELEKNDKKTIENEKKN